MRSLTPLGWRAEAANLNGDNTVAPAINPSLRKWTRPGEISFTADLTKLTRTVQRHSRCEDYKGCNIGDSGANASKRWMPATVIGRYRQQIHFNTLSLSSLHRVGEDIFETFKVLLRLPMSTTLEPKRHLKDSNIPPNSGMAASCTTSASVIMFERYTKP